MGGDTERAAMMPFVCMYYKHACMNVGIPSLPTLTTLLQLHLFADTYLFLLFPSSFSSSSPSSFVPSSSSLSFSSSYLPPSHSSSSFSSLLLLLLFPLLSSFQPMSPSQSTSPTP